MNERERRQVSLIVGQESDAARRAVRDSNEAIYGAHAVKGRLQSGATIIAIVDNQKSIAEGFVTNVAAKVRAVASDTEAFEAVSRAGLDCLAVCASQMPRLFQITGLEESSPAGLAGSARWEAARVDVERTLSILEYDFGQSENPPLLKTSPMNQGGRPRAAFWEDMWAKIAADLFVGDLKPSSQADVERAMADWISANGHTAADSVIRDRARSLWRLIG